MAHSPETGQRNSLWKDWYPTVVANFDGLDVSESKYGDPEPETIGLFAQSQKRLHVLDVGGGDGKNAIPIAQLGHTVYVSDVDMPHLKRAQQRADALVPKDSGKVFPILADATKHSPFVPGTFDAVINAGFGYLIPPDELEPVFQSMSEAISPGGLVVFEFATDRVRRSIDGEEIVGTNEYKYSHKEGKAVLTNLFDQYHIEHGIFPTLDSFKEYPDRTLESKLIIASGRKQR